MDYGGEGDENNRPARGDVRRCRAAVPPLSFSVPCSLSSPDENHLLDKACSQPVVRLWSGCSSNIYGGSVHRDSIYTNMASFTTTRVRAVFQRRHHRGEYLLHIHCAASRISNTYLRDVFCVREMHEYSCITESEKHRVSVDDTVVWAQD